MMHRQVLRIEGTRFVLIEESKLKRLERGDHAGKDDFQLPPLPAADRAGNRPALEFVRASLARDIIRERRSLGLTQRQLANLAGIRPETLSRLESAKHSPTVRTVERIERALQKVGNSRSGRFGKSRL